MNRLRIVGAFVLVAVLVILMVQNRDTVTTRLLWARVEMPQSILLLVTAVLGFGSGALFAWFRLRPRRERGGKNSAAGVQEDADTA